MEKRILEHYLQTGAYTYAGPYKEYFKTLPDKVDTLGKLVCGQVIHRITLKEGNTNANADLRYGDMTKYPWYRMRCEDDVLLTTVAMTGELFRLDERGLVSDWAADTWLGIREGTKEGSRFIYADSLGTNSLKAAVRYLFYDFHALMNHELTFSFLPSFLDDKLDALTKEDMQEFDRLARLMLEPDKNFDQLKYMWENERKYRIMNSPLVRN